MKVSIVVSCLLMLAATSFGHAADVSVWREHAVRAPVYDLRVPQRSPGAAMLRASDTCWRGCEQQCGWRFQACLRVDGQGTCIAQTDACDRTCQSQCRLYGGPLLPIMD
jgi:hypothetical protein